MVFLLAFIEETILQIKRCDTTIVIFMVKTMSHGFHFARKNICIERLVCLFLSQTHALVVANLCCEALRKVTLGQPSPGRRDSRI